MTRVGAGTARTLLAFAGILLANFALLHLAGADWLPEGSGPGSTLDREQIELHVETVRGHYGFDRPLFSRFGTWIARVARLDFGESTRELRPVVDVIGDAWRPTLLLQGAAMLVMLAAGIPLGVLLATRADSLLDRLATASLFGVYSVPAFWSGTLLLVWLATDAGFALFPLAGLESDDPSERGALDTLSHLVLPVCVLTLPGLVVITRLVRASMIETLDADHIRAAVAAGVSRRTATWRLALRSALVPVVTAMGSMLPELVVGSIVTERLFAIAGLGTLTWDSTMARDLPVLQALMLMTAVTVLIGFRLADVAASRLDPRTRR